MRKGFVIGSLSVLIGALLILNFISGIITGFVIAKGMTTVPGFVFGIIFFIGGLALLAFEVEGRVREGNLARQIMESGAVVDTRKLKKIAHKMGYDSREVKEGYQVLGHDGKPLTVIPNHRMLSTGVYRGILKSLATGESSFRRYY